MKNKKGNCGCCDKPMNIGNWYPETDGQESHYLAGEEYQCLNCGCTLKIQQFYKDFLQSKQWKELRFKILIRDGFGCQDCGEEACEVHHENYSNIFDENTCISLCHNCHGKIHGKNTLKKNGWAESINITRMAKRFDLLNCPKCNEKLRFIDKYGFFFCEYCKVGGDLKDFAKLISSTKEILKE